MDGCAGGGRWMTSEKGRGRVMHMQGPAPRPSVSAPTLCQLHPGSPLDAYSIATSILHPLSAPPILPSPCTAGWRPNHHLYTPPSPQLHHALLAFHHDVREGASRVWHTCYRTPAGSTFDQTPRDGQSLCHRRHSFAHHLWIAPWYICFSGLP